MGRASKRWTGVFAAALFAFLAACALPKTHPPAPMRLPPAPNPETGWLHYEPAVVVLSGTLRKETVSERTEEDEDEEGPMQRATIYVLELDAPLKVLADPESPRNYATFVNETRVQLSLDKNDSDLLELADSLKDAPVTAKGSLLQGDSPHHHTDVLLRVTASDGLSRRSP